MKIFFQYMRLELKRMLLSLPGICVGSILMLALIAGFLFICHTGNTDTQKKEPVTIGVVADEDEPFVDWMITTISNIKKTQDTFCFKRMSEEVANKQLQKGEISIIFIIPEQYIASIIKGANKHVTIRFAKEQTTIVSFLLRQLSEAASSFILNSEAGIYSMQEYYEKYNLPNQKEDELTLNIQYIKEISNLKDGMTVEMVQTDTSYPMTSVYLVSAIVLFSFLWGLTCSKMLTSQKRAFQNQLWRNGMKQCSQLFARGIAFFTTNLANFAILILLASILILTKKFTLTDTLLTDIGGLWKFAVLLIPVLILTSAFIQLVYEITEDAFGGILFLFFSVMLMGLFSGCFYPLEYLPEMLQNIGKYLPVYHLCQYSLSILYKSFDKMALIYTLLYSVIFYAIILFVRHIRRLKNID